MRLIWTAVKLAWPHLLAPWRSPLLRWRMETYGVRAADGRLLAADEISPRIFLAFVFHNRLALLRFLRWASRL